MECTKGALNTKCLNLFSKTHNAASNIKDHSATEIRVEEEEKTVAAAAEDAVAPAHNIAGAPDEEDVKT